MNLFTIPNNYYWGFKVLGDYKYVFLRFSIPFETKLSSSSNILNSLRSYSYTITALTMRTVKSINANANKLCYNKKSGEISQ